MKRTIFIWLLILGLTSMKYAAAQCRLDKSNYQIVIDEQFDNYGGSVTNLTGPNSIWKATLDDPNSGWAAEYYLPSQTQLVSDGNGGYLLRLVAEKLPNQITLANNRVVGYKSGVFTLKKSNQLPITNIPFDPPASTTCPDQDPRGFAYGMFEIRCKTPAGDPNFWDTWPAFWLISAGAELDIIDDVTANPGLYYNSNINDWTKQPGYNGNVDWVQDTYCATCPGWRGDINYNIGDRITTSSNVTYRAVNNITAISCNKTFYSSYRNLSDEFTTYTAVWTPDKITFFVENRELYTIDKSLAKLTNECPLNIIANLAMFKEANILPYPQQFYMDIDYIKVYKPINNNYTLPYKYSSEFINHNVFENISNAVLVSSKVNSIATNPNNPNEVFYRGVDNYIYVANKINNTWQVKKLEFNTGPVVLAAGDIKYLPIHDALIYVGADNRINWFGRSTTEPSGFFHWHLSSNWNCYSCVTGEEIYAEEGSLQVSPNGEVFYRGTDNKMHWFCYSNGNWQHQVLYYPPISSNVTGNIVIDPANNTNQVFYRGADGSIQNFYKTSATTYVHGWVGSSSFKVNSMSGSMAWSPSLNGILYIGVDNKLHTYYWNGSWTHELIPYNYGDPSLGYTNGDYIKNGIVWEDNGKSLYYTGFDGRTQSLFKYGSSWYHSWIDHNWNNRDFLSFNSQSPIGYSSSVITGWDTPEKSIFYTNKDNKLMYFKYEPCEYALQTCVNPLDKNIFKYSYAGNSSVNTPKMKISIYPNPSADYISIDGVEMDIPKRYKIMDLTGKTLIEKIEMGNIVDIAVLSPGIYLLSVDCYNQVYNFKIHKK